MSEHERVKKMRQQNSAQITLEYIIIFAVVAGATLITLTSWDNNVRTYLEQLFLSAVDKLQ